MNDSPTPSASPDMPTETHEPTGKESLLQLIGSRLNQSRESSGKSIEEAVRKLKLQKRHLLALEKGQWDNMPDDVYMLGFLRQYSQYLQLDLADEIERLKHEQYALTKPLTFPDPPLAPSRRWAWLAGIAFILLFMLFNISTEQRIMDGADVSNALPVSVTESVSTGLSSPALQEDASNDDHHDLATATAPSVVPPVAEIASPSQADATPKTSNTAKQAEESISEQTNGQTNEHTNEHTKSASIPAIAQVESAMHHFRFDAVGSPIWLQIFMPDRINAGKGKLLKEVLLQPGYHATINEKTAVLWITCGNAPALRIQVDGHLFADTGTLGAGKKVLRDFRFDIHMKSIRVHNNQERQIDSGN